VTGLQATNARLKTEVVQLQTANKRLTVNMEVLGMELKAAEARASTYQSIKEDIYAIPETAGVPADIRAALERLRDH
jgi:hypothetical protein